MLSLASIPNREPCASGASTAEGDAFDGPFAADAMAAEGSFVARYADGSTYFGGFAAGRWHGWGLLRDARDGSTPAILAAAGGKVGIFDLNEDAGQAMVAELGADNCVFAKVNVVDEDSAKAGIEAAVSAFGTIHINVNCAGIGGTDLAAILAYWGLPNPPIGAS